MGRYIQRRILISIPMLLVITIITFVLLRLAPGDPLNSYIPPDAALPPEAREALRRELGLDQPLLVQYFYWFKEAIQGNCMSCHDTESPGLRSLAQIRSHAAKIMDVAVYTDAMPEDATMTIEERRLLGEWLACGAP